ncbi:YggS family pyridoxal phosphate-dependent enzyme [Flexivirga meconopsidis]|uniref:YggS family pyridoxal phosphate-dependent enzyme n=1 Tax=Flexivirga meconopsidis TaxID=2977121 RepID=UPI00223FB6B1|nr:YggS family pyridoxal phosphate-dependent enzyme [Flexivirga meconopsidis]
MYDGSPRRDELAARLATVRERIDRACDAAGRSAEDVTLIAVTKFFPASDVAILAELGVHDVGENRDQEASAKVDELPPEVRDRLTVHFVGQLQSNKAGHVARYADVVQSVDRPKIARALDRAAAAADRRLEVLLQVDLSGAAGRGGVAPEAARALADEVAESEALRLRGVMAVAPLGEDPAPAFERLAGVAHAIREGHPDADWMSAGMSGDLEQAVAAGATHLRVGSAILGSRPLAR